MLEQFIPFFNTIITLFILLMIGVVAGKFNIIDSIASKRLSTIIIKIGQPALIISSLIKMEYSAKNLKLGLQTLAFGFAFHIVISAIAFLIFIKFKDINERKLTEFCAIFGNVGFLGIPILESLLGDKGAFMAAFFVVSFNVVLWTWGICILARKRDDIKLTPKKLLNFGTVPCMIGFVLYLCCRPFFEFPAFIMSGLSYTASLCTPVSMLIIGALLATRSMKQIFCSGKIYLLCAIKLLAVPLLVALCMKLFGFGKDWIIFGTAMAGMPSATMVTMFAETYDIEPGYSAQAVGATSLFSTITLPAVIILAQLIAG